MVVTRVKASAHSNNCSCNVSWYFLWTLSRGAGGVGAMEAASGKSDDPGIHVFSTGCRIARVIIVHGKYHPWYAPGVPIICQALVSTK